MIPPPRFNMIRFHGVFAPNAQLRSEVVPKKEVRKLAEQSAAELGLAEQTHLFEGEPATPKRNPWAWLMNSLPEANQVSTHGALEYAGAGYKNQSPPPARSSVSWVSSARNDPDLRSPW